MERPSGVSSARDERYAARLSSSSNASVERDELGGPPVAQGDGAGLVQEEGVHVAGYLDGPAALGEHVRPHGPVHPGDTYGREKGADGRGDQADQQRYEGRCIDRLPGVDGEGQQRHRDDEEDGGESGEQDGQGDLVWSLLAARALDEGYHGVQEALAGIGGYLDDDAV